MCTLGYSVRRSAKCRSKAGWEASWGLVIVTFAEEKGWSEACCSQNTVSGSVSRGSDGSSVGTTHEVRSL